MPPHWVPQKNIELIRFHKNPTCFGSEIQMFQLMCFFFLFLGWDACPYQRTGISVCMVGHVELVPALRTTHGNGGSEVSPQKLGRYADESHERM